MDGSTKPSRAREQAEEALFDPPRPHPAALPPRLLANRPFVWLVASFAVSQLGFWGFLLAIMGEAGYRFHASAGQLGMLFAAFSVVFVPLTVPLGMLVDQWSPKWVMLLSSIVGLGSVIAALVASSVSWLYLAFALDGVAAAAVIPARGSLTGMLVEERDLIRANGMLNAMSMLAVIVGPAVAGLLERGAKFDPSVYWYALVATAIGGALVVFIPDRRSGGSGEQSFAEDLAEGFRVSWREPELRSLLLLTCAAWFLTTVLITLEPLFVKHVLHRGLDALGYLWAVHGVGALVGAVVISRSKRAQGREVVLISVSLIVCGVGFLAYVGTSLIGVAVAGTAVFGVGFAWFLTLSQSLIQRVAAENVRGRVTAVVGMLQEGAGVVCALILAGIGGLIANVQPYLVWSAVAMAVVGFFGIRAARRLHSAEVVADAIEADV